VRMQLAEKRRWPLEQNSHLSRPSLSLGSRQLVDLTSEAFSDFCGRELDGVSLAPSARSARVARLPQAPAPVDRYGREGPVVDAARAPAAVRRPLRPQIPSVFRLGS
jgi:hypothetical protein